MAGDDEEGCEGGEDGAGGEEDGEGGDEVLFPVGHVFEEEGTVCWH